MNKLITIARRRCQRSVLLLVGLLTAVIVRSSTAHAQVNEQPVESLSGYTPEEGFRLRSADGAYLLRVALQMGIKLEPSWTEGDRDLNGMFSFLRPILRGNLVQPWFTYRLSLELAGDDPSVLDAYFDVAPMEEFGLRVGQQGTPHSRHTSFGPQQIFFPDFASVSSYFWSGRDRGITAYGTLLAERLDYYVGLYGGSPVDETVEFADNYVLEARLTSSPLGPVNENELPFTPEGDALPFRVSFTLQGFYGQLQTVDESYDPANSVLTPDAALDTSELGVVGGDMWFQAGPAIFFAEVYVRQQRVVGTRNWYGALGAWAEIILNVLPNDLGAGVRFNWIEPNTELTRDNAFELEGAVAWFLKPPELTLKLRYAWLRQSAPEADDLGAFELPFAEGTTHVATLQLTMAF